MASKKAMVIDESVSSAEEQQCFEYYSNGLNQVELVLRLWFSYRVVFLDHIRTE